MKSKPLTRVVVSAVLCTAFLFLIASAQSNGQTGRSCSSPIQTSPMASASMLPSFRVGQIVEIQCWPQATFGNQIVPGDVKLGDLQPAIVRGDVIAFLQGSKHEVWIKRVIGIPGDKIQLKGEQITLNGREIARTAIGEYAVAGNGRAIGLHVLTEQLSQNVRYLVLEDSNHPPPDEIQSFLVPSDKIFVLGDNRDNSIDSRFTEIVGFVDVRNLVGLVRQ